MNRRLIFTHIAALSIGIGVGVALSKNWLKSSEGIFESVANFQKIKQGQTREELFQIMGKPSLEYSRDGKSVLGFSDFSKLDEVGLKWPTASPRYDAPFIVVLDEDERVVDVQDNASALLVESLGGSKYFSTKRRP